jgi:hypothetical protein
MILPASITIQTAVDRGSPLKASISISTAVPHHEGVSDRDGLARVASDKDERGGFLVWTLAEIGKLSRNRFF